MHERVDQTGAKIGEARRKAAFVFIFATILLDMLAMGVTIPVLPKLVVDFVGGDTQEAARIFGLFGTAWALMQFLFAPLQGTLSDSFGRRPVILMSRRRRLAGCSPAACSPALPLQASPRPTPMWRT